MPTITLESLKAAVTAKYEPLTIDMHEAGRFDLVMPLRLSDADLKALTKAQHDFNKIQEQSPEEPLDDDGKPRDLTEDEEEEMFNIRPRLISKLREIITIPASDKTLCASYLGLVGDDLPALMELVSMYQDSTQVGEASASQSS